MIKDLEAAIGYSFNNITLLQNAADQLLGLGKSRLIGVHDRFSFLVSFLLDRLHGQAGIAPYACVAGMAVFVVLLQAQGFNTLHRAREEIGLLSPVLYGAGGQ